MNLLLDKKNIRYFLSIAIATPIPPPTHKDTTPFFFPVLFRMCNRVTSTLAPKNIIRLESENSVEESLSINSMNT